MKVAVLWSGGKESCLAYERAMAHGYDVTALVTFILDSWPSICHPLSIMSLQSKALGIPHITLKVGEPYREAYRHSISDLVKTDGIQALVTGDIWMEDHRRWMESVCDGLGINPIMPLWKASTYEILDTVISGGFKPVFTCVKEPWFNERWLGRQLDRESFEELTSLHQKFGIDLCGENGEYHTMVLDGPTFKQAIRIEESSKERKNSTLHLKAQRLSLQPKTE
jgi:uncharacterized protein (TIGR00290 family)